MVHAINFNSIQLANYAILVQFEIKISSAKFFTFNQESSFLLIFNLLILAFSLHFQVYIHSKSN